MPWGRLGNCNGRARSEAYYLLMIAGVIVRWVVTHDTSALKLRDAANVGNPFDRFATNVLAINTWADRHL